MVGNPRAVQAFGRLVQSVLREAILLAQRPKGTFPLLLLEMGNGSRSLPVRICPHAAQPPLPFRQDRVIQLASRFQIGTHPPGLTSRHPERQFQEKRGRLLALLVWLCV